MNPTSDELHANIERYLSGDMTPLELEAFEKRLTQRETERAAFRCALRLDANLRSLAAKPKIKAAAWMRERDADQHSQGRTIRPAIMQWRPLAAAAAGLVMGLFGASVLWAYAGRTGSVTSMSVPVRDESFEGSASVLSDGMPSSLGQWSGDYSQVVKAEQGIIPASGQQMLRVLRSDSRVDPSGLDSHGGDIMQLVDLRSQKEWLSSGNAVLEVTAEANMVSAREGERFSFAVQALAYSGQPEDLRTADGGEVLQSALASGLKRVQLDSDPATWQSATARLLLPADADFVLVKLTVTQKTPRKAGHVEFAGHYIDDVKLVLKTQPSGFTRAVSR